MIYLYIGVIVFAAFLIVLFFALNKDRREKKIEKYKQQKLDEAQKQQDELPKKSEQEQKVEEAVEQGELENFTLEESQDAEGESDEVETEEDDSARKNFEDSFAEYEKFLKENNINLDDLDDDENEDEEESKTGTKIINTKDFEGKSRDEIIEMLSGYTPEEQSIILDQLIGKKEDS